MTESRAIKPLWAPQGAQAEFLEAREHEVLLHGGRGGGKSSALLVSFFQHVALGYGRDFHGVIFRQEEGDLESVRNQLRWFHLNIYPGSTIVYTPHTKMTWPTGETLHLAHLSKPSDYDRWHGSSVPFLGFEELTQWATPDLYLAMLSTSRSSNPKVPLLVRATTNPSGPGSSWVKKRFIDNQEPGRKHIQLLLEENKVLLAANPNYAETIAKAARDSEERKAWLEGRWDLAIGGMFDLWDPRVHVVRDVPFEKIPRSWRFDRSYDHGTASPFSVGFWAESNGESFRHEGKLYGAKRGDLYRIAEWYGGDDEGNGLGLDAREIAIGIKEREARMRIRFFRDRQIATSTRAIAPLRATTQAK
jgi:hypothetical protein